MWALQQKDFLGFGTLWLIGKYHTTTSFKLPSILRLLDKSYMESGNNFQTEKKTVKKWILDIVILLF